MASVRTRTFSALDLNFVGTALTIAAVGCLLIYSATYFSDPALSILRKQFLWVGIGVVLMLLFLLVDYHVFFDVAPILYLIGIAMLLYLLVFGRLTANVRSWIHIGSFQFQPSEFMKIFTALMLARFFGNYKGAYLDLRAFLKAMAIIAIPVTLILLQPDFGTCATFFPLVGAAMFFGGIRWRVWIGMAVACALLAFLDTREGANQQITAAKMDKAGNPMWGPNGVQLTSDSSSHFAPKVTGTSDGGVVVAWTAAYGNTSNVKLMKLDTISTGML